MKPSALQDEDKYILRLPDGMRQQLAAVAKGNGRSLNAEMIYRLRQSFLVPDDVAAACARIGGVKDSLDFAARLFEAAGFVVTITLPDKKD